MQASQPQQQASQVSSLLYCFLTHQKHLASTKERVSRQNVSHLIVVGGCSSSYLKENTLYLACSDTYDGLPEKVVSLCQYITTHPEEFQEYTHIVKLDEDMVVRKPLLGSYGDYSGKIETKEGNRRWHIGKCAGSPWNNKVYLGFYVPWCLGGYGYIVSRKAMTYIARLPLELVRTKEIYEDLMVAKCLLYQGIRPSSFPIQEYIQSPDHR